MQPTVIVKTTDTNQVIASYDAESTHIDLKKVPLTFENAKVLAVACKNLQTVTVDGTTYNWMTLKPWLNPPRTPKDLTSYWASAKNSQISI